MVIIMKMMGLFVTLVMLVFWLCSCGFSSEPILTDTPSPTATKTPSESPETAAPQSVASTQIPSSTPGEIPTKEPDETVNIAGLFSFGMKVSEVRDILLVNGFEGEDLQGTRFNSTLDNGVHENLDAGEHAFTFDAFGKLYEFWTSYASTARGFTPGEDVTRMAELYGDNYKEYALDNNKYICEYDFGEYYLEFYADHDTGTIKTWEVSRYSFEESLGSEQP